MTWKRTRDQIKLNLKPGNIAYSVELGNYLYPLVFQIKITGICEEYQNGYTGITAGKGYDSYDEHFKKILDKEGNPVQDYEIHTCNMLLFKTKKEAMDMADKLRKDKIKEIKEQEKYFQRYLQDLLKYKDTYSYMKFPKELK